ncbi:MAG: GH116 family glycosyl hydrolase [Candidatus ainarchaeum sp.]|nr:GH116 family glycosyl hydrolase [Candidatus ainarchaeum sp.]
MHPEVEEAFSIAAKCLQKCYSEKGILAGSVFLKEYRARDSFFACFGAMELGDFEIAKKNLELFFGQQGPKGILPLFFDKKLKPSYKMIVGKPIDATALGIIAFTEYVDKTKDLDFARQNFGSLKKAVDWLVSRDKDKDFLVEETVLGNWAESVLKYGTVLYSNACFFKAIDSFERLCILLKQKELAETASKTAISIKRKINEEFWTGAFYADWIFIQKHDYFAADGNLLAAWWEIADEEQGQMIANKIKQHQLNKWPLQTNYPAYPFWRLPLVLMPLQEYHIHNGFSWLWLGCLNAIVLDKIGWKKEARQEIRKISEIIIENKCVHDFLFEGKPVNSLFLKSEPNSAWAAGMFVKAVKEIGKSKG